MSFSEDPTTKIRKPFPIKKSRENWTEQEHDRFLEALHLFNRDWKKIEAFVGSKTVVQIRSHAQNYFLKVQKSGANEHLSLSRPRRKASHPCPQKAPKNVAFTSQVIGNLPSSSTPLLEPSYLYSSDPQPLLGSQAACASSSSSWKHESINLPKPILEEEPGVSAKALPRNHCYSTVSKEDTRKLLTVTKPNDEESCEKPHRAMPNFAEVVQIRSHAQKYFLKFQKSGANEHLPPPRPKRKASHPCPQKAPKNVAFTSHVIGNLPSCSTPLPEPGYLYSSDPQPLLGNQAACASSSSSWNHESTNLPKPVLEEEPGVSATALPRNHCWSNLPLDLMQLVFKRLGFADFQRAKSVCSSWQSGSRLSQPNNQIPWMISFPRDQNYCLLFNPEEKEKVYKTRDFDDDFAKSFCVATHRSWLLMLDPKYGDWCKGNNENPDYNFYILHLFTGERINLPTLETELGFTPDPVFWIDEKTKDYYLVIKMINREYTVSLTKGDNSWKQIPQSSLSDMDHKLYCPSDYKLKVFYLFGGMPPLVFGISGCIQRAPSPYCRRLPDIPMPNEMSQSRKKVVVTLSGDILIVNSFRPVFSRIWKFRVYKLKGNKWEEINSLGDEAILLDLGITVLAKDLHGVQKNSIYFTGPHFQYPCVENDIFLFNLNTNKIEKPHQFVSSSIPFYSCWFLPSFKP